MLEQMSCRIQEISIFIIPKCDTAPVVNSLMEQLLRLFGTSQRITHLCDMAAECVVQHEGMRAPSDEKQWRQQK